MPLFSLTELISPLSEKEFFDVYWQQRVYHASGRPADSFSGLIGAGDIEATLPVMPNAISPADIYAIDSRKPRPEGGPKDPYDTYRDGATLKVDKVHQRFVPLNHLCRMLEERFHCVAGANLYLTPPHSQGFRIHSDYEDVIVLQISGEKHWEIWDPVYPLPLRGENTPVPENLPPPKEKLTLKAGEVLYCPRGFPHHARTGDLASLHITLGIHTTLWIDLVLAAAMAAARDNTAFREALPAGFLRKGAMGEDADQRLRSLFRVLAEEPDLPGAMAELGERVVQAQTMLRDRHFTVICGLESLNPRSMLRKRLGTISFLRKTDKDVSLYFGHKIVKMPAKAVGALEFIVAAGTFAVDDIPGLNAESRLVLARRLIRDGYLTISDQL